MSAFRSRDGVRWVLACRTDIPLHRDLWVGLAAAAPNTYRSSSVSYEHVQHEQRMRSSHGVRVELVSGSVLQCVELEYDTDVLRFFGPESRPRVPLEQIARIVFQSIPGRAERRLQIGQPGALLTTGDFVEGTPRSLIEGMLTIDSVLLGRTRADSVNEVIAVVFRPSRPSDSRYRVELRDGSVFRTRSLAVEGYSLKLHEPALGECLVSLADVASFERE